MSNEIKSVISLLCKQLNIIFDISLKPEYFRLAKFDKTDENVIPVLWSVLSLFTTKQNEIDVQKIKNHMKSLNYKAHRFYELPEDFSSGSRELLIAISFVVAKYLPDLIRQEIRNSPFDDSCCLIDLSVHVDKPDIPHGIDEKGIKNYFMWLKGKTQQNAKMTEEYKTQITKIYEKLNNLLNNKASGKLSLNEVLALSSKKYCKEFMDKSSHILSLLECYQDWTRKEKIFWKWMVKLKPHKRT